MHSENTDYAARAKGLIKKTAQAGALVIVPLALAVQAHGSVMLPTANTCSFAGNNCTSTTVTTQLPDANGLEGISMAMYGVFNMGVSGSSGNQASFALDASGPLTMDGGGSSCNGTGNPCDLSTFLFSWDSSIQAYQSGSTGLPLGSKVASFNSTYSVEILLDGTAIYQANLPVGFTDGPLVSASGSAAVAIPGEFQDRISNLVSGSSGGNVDFRLALTFSFIGIGGSNTLPQYTEPLAHFSVTAAPTAAPEPATAIPAMAGLLGISAWLRRRRRQRM